MIVFALSSGVLWVLLAWEWPGWRKAYAQGYAQMANDVFGSWSHGVIRFMPEASESGIVELRCTNRVSRQQLSKDQNARLLAYLPTAATLALCAATPLPPLRRLRRIIVGLVLVHCFLFVRVGIATLYMLTLGESSAVLPLSDPLRWLVESAQYVVVTCMPISFIVPVFIWLLAMIRPSEWTFSHSTQSAAQPVS
ncbi:MAG: hypothetical protein JNG88_07025 [Phycisphaerales bacterium]|nr:hypothetical protein [Phycisphaerales bacterium]